MLDCRQVSLSFNSLRNKQSTLAQYMVACFVDMWDNSAMQYPAEPHGCDSECNSQRMRALSLCDCFPRAHFTSDRGVLKVKATSSAVIPLISLPVRIVLLSVCVNSLSNFIQAHETNSINRIINIICF